MIFSNMMKILFRKLAMGKLACVYMPPKLLICQIIQNQTTTGSHFLGETKIKNQNKIIAGSGYFKNLQELVVLEVVIFSFLFFNLFSEQWLPYPKVSFIIKLSSK